MNKTGGGELNDWLNSLRRKLPVLKSKQFGTWGPGFGVGAGCGIGFGIGLMGGFGPGLPGLQLVIGPGAGCGVGFGLGYGYGVGRGRGIAYQENLQGRLPSEDEIATLVDKFAMNTKTLVKATYDTIDKWRRF